MCFPYRVDFLFCPYNAASQYFGAKIVDFGGCPDILPSVGTQICNFGDPETPFGDPGERFWSSRGAPGQPRGPLRVPGGSILGPWGTILATQGSTGTAQRTPVGPDVDFHGFRTDF